MGLPFMNTIAANFLQNNFLPNESLEAVKFVVVTKTLGIWLQNARHITK